MISPSADSFLLMNISQPLLAVRFLPGYGGRGHVQAARGVAVRVTHAVLVVLLVVGGCRWSAVVRSVHGGVLICRTTATVARAVPVQAAARAAAVQRRANGTAAATASAPCRRHIITAAVVLMDVVTGSGGTGGGNRARRRRRLRGLLSMVEVVLGRSATGATSTTAAATTAATAAAVMVVAPFRVRRPRLLLIALLLRGAGIDHSERA